GQGGLSFDFPDPGARRWQRRLANVSLTAILVLTALVVSSSAQSGRRKSEVKKNPTIIDSTPASSSSNKTPAPDPEGIGQSGKKGSKPSEDTDGSDTLRITSNLVPVPASVVDGRGTAVTNLKLEDFELRVDGQIKTIADLNRSETPVSLAMLFDN